MTTTCATCNQPIVHGTLITFGYETSDWYHPATGDTRCAIDTYAVAEPHMGTTNVVV